jgi:aspartyl/asparaginyl-tRNA synthetase
LHSLREYLYKKHFVEISCPTLVISTDDAPYFVINYYRRRAVLTTSPQLNLQFGVNLFDRVFALQSVFRKEKNLLISNEHLSEFQYLGIEVANIDYRKLMDFVESLIAYVLNTIRRNCKDDIHQLKINVPTMNDCQKIAFSTLFPNFKASCPPKDYIINKRVQELSKKAHYPFWIIDWPEKEKDEWYYENKDEFLTKTMDLILPKGYNEVASGGQRELSYNDMIRKMLKKGIDPKKYQWYLNAFRYKIPPHAGCGIGIDRLVRWICNLRSVKDTVFMNWEGNLF